MQYVSSLYTVSAMLPRDDQKIMLGPVRRSVHKDKKVEWVIPYYSVQTPQ